MFDNKLLEYLIVTDQVDEFLGLKEENEDQEETYDDEDEEYEMYYNQKTKKY